MDGMTGGFVAGSIVSKLVLDKTGWNQSVRGVADDERKLGASVGRIGDRLGGIGTKMAAVGAIVVGSFSAMIKKTADMGDQVYDLSQRTGVGTETLSALRLAADQSGTSMEGVALGFRKLGITMTEANTGNKEAVDLFKSLKISVADSAGNMRDMDAVMLEVADRFAGMEDGAEKAYLAQKLFGRSGGELIPLLNLGRKGLEEQMEAAKKLGIVFSEEAAAKCDEFNDRLDALKLGLGGAGKELAMTLMPMVTDFAKKVTDVVVKVREWVATHPELARQIGSVALKVGALLSVVGPLLMLLPKLISGVGSLTGFLASSVGIWTVAAGAVAFYAVKLLELKDARKGAEEAEKRWQTNQDSTRKILADVAAKAGFTAQQFDALTAKYGENLSELRKAITAGKEGTAIQGTLAEAVGKHKKAVEEQKKATEAFIPVLVDVAAKQKTWGEIMEEYGVLSLKDKKEKIAELLGYEEKLGRMLKDGAIDSTEYGKGIRKINDELADLGATTVTRVLPSARDFSDLMKRAPGVMSDAAYTTGTMEQQIKALGDQFGVTYEQALLCLYQLKAFGLLDIKLPDMPFSSAWVDPAKVAANEVSTRWSQLYDDIKADFGDTFATLASEIGNNLDFLNGEFFDHAINIKAIFQDLWGSVKDAFFRMIGDMVGDWVLTQFKNLFDSIGKAATNTMADAASTAVGAAADITKGASAAISGLWTGLGAAVGSFLGTVLAGVLAGGPSGHQQEQQINDTKDARNFLAEIRNWFFSAGSGFGGASYEFITGHIGEWLTWINDSTRAVVTHMDSLKTILHGDLVTIDKSIRGIAGAQHGAVLTSPQLVMTHGTPRVPEWVLPETDIKALLRPMASARAATKGMTIQVKNEVNVNGTMITDRDYVRTRLLKEIEAALKAGVNRTQLKMALGV